MTTVHFVVFEANSEERTRPDVGMELCGDRDLKAVSPGDTLWVITRVGADRPVPALCGRLNAREVAPHAADDANFDASHSDCALRLLVDEGRSERCVPFPCVMIDSWDIWRQPFRGVRELTQEQGRTLEIEWAKAVRQAR